MKPGWLTTYRVAAIAAIAALVHLHAPATALDAMRHGDEIDTSPICDQIIGYSGPNRCAIDLDEQRRIRGVRLVSSGDTVEHAEAVRQDDTFWDQFEDRDAVELLMAGNLDAVSGATLTSLAIIESVAHRLHQLSPGDETRAPMRSLRFPDALKIEELQDALPNAHDLERAADTRHITRDAQGISIGFALRTGPGSEAITGYQGPTDSLLVFDSADTLRSVTIRSSYDNERYVGYVREDAFFTEPLLGRTLAELEALDPQSVDGVSGATMTSRAVVRGIIESARAVSLPNTSHVSSARSTRNRTEFTSMLLRHAGLILAIAFALLMTWSRLRSNRTMRIITRIGAIVYLGLTTGYMLSQGLLFGWAKHGVPWQVAPGLVLLAGVAFAVPITTGHQAYCHQLCAHGALQELLRKSPWQRDPPAALVRVLRWVPGTTLLLLGALLVAEHFGAFANPAAPQLAAIEPFGAWAWPLAGVVTCTVAVVSLAASSIYSMAYCRFGCPSGAMLDLVRRRSHDRFGVRDGGLAALLFLALAFTLAA